MAELEVPHPREVFALVGHAPAEAQFEAARSRGRLHHAWLLTGPEGAGKATFAYRAARRLLGAPADEGFGILGADPDHPVSRQVMARSHPDLLVLEREGPDGKPRKVIPVEEARRLAEFFSKSPASAPHRVAIVDAADDLNVNAANAILKTLEEPPPAGVLLMVAVKCGPSPNHASPLPLPFPCGA
jgi:DNA polymerase-3 subunit delta'